MNNINNASADQVNDLVSSFIADGVTFGIAHKSYQATHPVKSTTALPGVACRGRSPGQAKTGKAFNNPKIPQLKIGKTEMTPANSTIIKAPTKQLKLMQQPFPKKLNDTSSMQRRNQLPATIRSNQKPRSITPTKIAANSVAKKTSQTKSSKSSSSTDTQIQKAAQNKTTVAEQKSFKPAVEESAKKTGLVVLKNEKIIINEVLSSERVGSALKKDAHHAFNDIIDNYASCAQEFALRGADGKTRKLFQIEGSINGAEGVFEWIVEPQNQLVTHRLFIKNGSISGKPNMFGEK